MLHLWNGLGRLRSAAKNQSYLIASAIVFGMSLPAASQAADGGRARFDRGGEWRRDDDRRGHDRHDHDRGDWRRDRDHRGHDHRDRGGRIDVDIRIGGGHRHPEYETRQTRVWVPPVYRTVVDRRWVEPVYRTECERVWVPERIEEREVRRRHHGHWHTRIERIVIEPGHFDTVERRVCVREGHWETFERQELVCAGHYEVRTERVRRPYRVSPFAVVNPLLGRTGVAGL